MNALAVHRQTPGLSVRDPRGLTVRAVSYWRDSALAPAQARVNRSVIDSVGRVVAEWDPRLVAQPTAPANLTRVYSLSNKVLGSNSVDAGWRTSLFAEAGQQVHGWDARGNERWIEYDTLLRPVAVFEQAACVERLHYAEAAPHFGVHNQCGQLIRHDNPAGTQHFNEFGLAGAVLEQHQHFLQRLDVPDWPLPLDERDDLLERAAGARTTLQFNPVGNVLEQTDAQGNRQRFNHTIDGQLREAWLQLKNATVPQRLVHEIRYNAQGQVERQTAGNKVTSRFDYCPKTGLLIRLWAAGPGDEPLQDLRYVHDPVGNILSLEDKALPVRFYANQRIEPINRYTYDSLYQLIEATGWEAGSANRGPAHIEDPAAVANYRQTYRYDAGGNLLELIHHGPQQHGRMLTAAKHSNRCLPEVGGRPPTEAQIAEGFDANGNLLVLDRGRTLSWDARNQLSHVHTVERTLGLDDTERYVYGADGMRQRKISSSQTNTRTVISETRYLPAGLEVRRVDADVMQVIKVQAGRETVQVLHWETPPPRQLAKDQYRYNLSDHLGSCSLELDSGAKVISRETYHPYGSTAFIERGDSSAESYRTLRYSGKERDATGMYYYGARYYMPWRQRWINPDPLGEVDGLNFYCMVLNNPIVFRDLTGNESVRSYFDEKDIEGYSSVFSSIKSGISAQGLNPSKTLYLMVGRSPQVLGMFIEQQGYSTALLQMSGMSAGGAKVRKLEDLSDEERANRSRFIEAAINGKDAGMQAIVMIDFSVTGNSISRAHEMLSDYYTLKGSGISIKMAVISRDTDKPTKDPQDVAILQGKNNVLFDPVSRKGYLQMHERGVLRFLKVQRSEVDKGLSYTDRFSYKRVDQGGQATVDPERRLRLGVMMRRAIEEFPETTAKNAKNLKNQRYGLGLVASGVSGVKTYINAHNSKRQTWFQRVFS